MEIIVAITGASGAIYGKKLLEVLRELNIYSHLIISKSAHITIAQELGINASELELIASKVHKYSDIAACISSGSYDVSSMIIAPCSVKTLAEIACGVSNNLISRAADVILKERKKLVLMLRETPLNLVHVNNIRQVTQAGAIVAPPVPAFYNSPQSINDIVEHSVYRVLDLVGIKNEKLKRWQGLK